MENVAARMLSTIAAESSEQNNGGVI